MIQPIDVKGKGTRHDGVIGQRLGDSECRSHFPGTAAGERGRIAERLDSGFLLKTRDRQVREADPTMRQTYASRAPGSSFFSASHAAPCTARQGQGVGSQAEPVACVMECSRPVRKNGAPLRRPSCAGDLEAETLCQRRWWPQGDAPVVGRRATGTKT